MKRNMFNQFIKASVIRAAKTFFQTILAMWTVGTVVTDVDWKIVFLTAASAAAYSLLTSIVAGLPEIKLEQSLYDLDNEADPAYAEEYAALEDEDIEDEDEEV